MKSTKQKRRLFIAQLLILVVLMNSENKGQVFSETNIILEQTAGGVAAWGDFDNNAKIDLFTIGFVGVFTVPEALSIYKNSGFGNFVDTNAELTGMSNGSIDIADFDNDNDIDVLATGLRGSSGRSRVYRNDSGAGFTLISTGLKGVNEGSGKWGDYDNDGDVDILITGDDTTKLYNNSNGVFIEVSHNMPATDGLISNSNGIWGDYDNDGDLDIFLMGRKPAGGRTTKIFKNTRGSFTDAEAGLSGIEGGTAEWGDYDSDGDLDLLIAGYPIGGIYKNTGGHFTRISISLPSESTASAAWGDFDNDGDLDIATTGAVVTKVFRNDGNDVFLNINEPLPELRNSAIAWGDYNNDGYLDFVVLGETTGYDRVTKIFKNIGNFAPNSPPEIPTGLTEISDDRTVILSWERASDAQTPSLGLTYNLRVGTTPGGSEVMSAMADPATGQRWVAKIGNVNHNTSWRIERLVNGTYYWSVQSVDNGFLGSEFTPERSFIIAGTDIHVNIPLELEGYSLDSNYPNPFNPSTTIAYAIPVRSQVSLKIYDTLGREVTTLVDAYQAAGTHNKVWNGNDSRDVPVSSGVYLFAIRSGKFMKTKKMLLLR